MSESNTCVYDNPDSMSREAWQNGKMVSSITATALSSKGFDGGRWFDFRLDVGHWETGKYHHGDESAILQSNEKRDDGER